MVVFCRGGGCSGGSKVAFPTCPEPCRAQPGSGMVVSAWLHSRKAALQQQGRSSLAFLSQCQCHRASRPLTQGEQSPNHQIHRGGHRLCLWMKGVWENLEQILELSWAFALFSPPPPLGNIIYLFVVGILGLHCWAGFAPVRASNATPVAWWCVAFPRWCSCP